MKVFKYTEDSIVAGQENNSDLFIRRVTFDSGYSEHDYHTHPNSFEFYIVLEGRLVFGSLDKEVEVQSGSIVYFEQGEQHCIVNVTERAVLLLLKRVGSLKE